MSFTKALYYPYIEIANPAWLKNAALFWKRIHTIVPSDIEPYREGTARKFFEADVLKPLYVESCRREIEELGEEVLDYLHTAEGGRILLSKGRLSRLHGRKLSEGLHELGKIHAAKFPELVREYFEKKASGRRGGDWLYLPSSFVNYYMTVLASHLSCTKGLNPVTDKSIFYDLLNLCKRGDTYPGEVSRDQIKRGILVNIIQQTVKISADTPVEKIIEFRDNHMNEMISFRERTEELARRLDFNSPKDAILQQLSDTNEIIQRHVDDLGETLKDMKIKCTIGSMKTALLGTSTILGAVIVGQSALIGGTLLTVACSALDYRLEKRKILRENPYTYLLSLRKTFG